MTIGEKKDELLARLASIQDAHERVAYIVARGRRHEPLAKALKTDEFQVEGCLARLWLVSGFKEGRCYFQTESDSAIMKGIAVLLCEFYSGQTPEEIVANDPSFLRKAGITQHLTPNRRNGLTQIWEEIRGFAQASLGRAPDATS